MKSTLDLVSYNISYIISYICDCEYSEEKENFWERVLSNSIVKCFLSVPSGVESAFNEPNRKFGNFAGGRKSKLD